MTVWFMVVLLVHRTWNSILVWMQGKAALAWTTSGWTTMEKNRVLKKDSERGNKPTAFHYARVIVFLSFITLVLLSHYIWGIQEKQFIVIKKNWLVGFYRNIYFSFLTNKRKHYGVSCCLDVTLGSKIKLKGVCELAQNLMDVLSIRKKPTIFNISRTLMFHNINGEKLLTNLKDNVR